MAKFVGGPYDGKELDIQAPGLNMIRLPDLDQWDVDEDPGATTPRHLPYLYKKDENSSGTDSIFRYVGEQTQLE